MKILSHEEQMLISGGTVVWKDNGYLVIKDSDKNANETQKLNFMIKVKPAIITTFMRDEGEKNQSLCIFGRVYNGETVEEGYFYRYNQTARCK